MKMQLKKVSKAVIGILSLAALAPVAVFAQITPTTGPNAPAVVAGSYNDVLSIINNAATWLFGILAAIAVVLLIYAAFLFLTSGGEEERVKTARKYVVYALIGLGIGIVAKGIISLIFSFLGQTAPTL